MKMGGRLSRALRGHRPGGVHAALQRSITIGLRADCVEQGCVAGRVRDPVGGLPEQAFSGARGEQRCTAYEARAARPWCAAGCLWPQAWRRCRVSRRHGAGRAHDEAAHAARRRVLGVGVVADRHRRQPLVGETERVDGGGRRRSGDGGHDRRHARNRAVPERHSDAQHGIAPRRRSSGSATRCPRRRLASVDAGTAQQPGVLDGGTIRSESSGSTSPSLGTAQQDSRPKSELVPSVPSTRRTVARRDDLGFLPGVVKQ